MNYEKQAEDFLNRHKLTFRTVLVGNACPPFCQDKDMDMVDLYPRKSHIHGKHYRCTVSGEGRGHLTIDFWNSYDDEEFNAFLGGSHFGSPKLAIPFDNPYWDKHRGGKYPSFRNARKGKRIPTAYDLFACIEKIDPGTFEDFCSNYGCNSDSRKDFRVWEECVNQYRRVKNFFTSEELEELQEIN